MILPLDIVNDPVARPDIATPLSVSVAQKERYSPERQRDVVRLIVACGLLALLGYLIVFASVAALSYPAHWAQAKEMLQIILPALIGIIGTVIGFYFGTAAASKGQGTPEP